MTETGIAAVQRPGSADLGTLGAPVPGYELRVAGDGELLVRSPHAPRGYRNRAAESAETYGADGWIHTGDLATLDPEGRLRLAGRKKEVLVLSHGHNVFPVQLESALKDACPQIGQVCVVGDARPHLAALVVPDPPEAAADAEVRGAIAAARSRINADLDPRERIEAHVGVADTWLPGGELTETLKLRRSRIESRYAETIDSMYG